MTPIAVFALLGQRRYWPIWAGQTLGAFNDNLFRYALVTMAAYQGLTILGLPPGEMAPIAATAFTLPLFLFSAVAGQVADKFDRIKIMRIAKFCEIFLMALAGAGFLLGEAWILLTVLFLMGVQTAFFVPARTAAMPNVLDRTELVGGNALLSGAINVMILAGAIGGTLLVGEVWGPGAIGAILIGCAVLGWLAMRQGVPAPASNPDMKISPDIFSQTVRMLNFGFRDKLVIGPLLGVAWFWLLAASVITVLPVLTESVLGGAPSVVALFQLLFTLGAAAGAVLCAVLSRGGEARWLSIAGAAGLVIFPLDLALQALGRTPGPELVEAAAFIEDPENRRFLFGLVLSAISGGLFLVPRQAMIQGRALPERRGRVMAASGILNGASATIGQLMLLALSRLGALLPSIFILIAIGSAIIVLTDVLRPREDPPAGEG
ncbi:MFS transporter [Alkalicaulis satelles]|uniref:MFS transporter n=1 Tax=Alkalicaulis satelles TaxID=2609175 RepID=A0A5M6ZLX1_9PROT|nr:MFS transporter [Alkalicaulis satelles]KAA5804734.1 MFS transporter [Alkalicaulis satelles]